MLFGVVENIKDFRQTQVDGVCWKYFCINSQPSNRILWLIGGSISVLDGAKVNPSKAVTSSVTEKRFSPCDRSSAKRTLQSLRKNRCVYGQVYLGYLALYSEVPVMIQL